MYKRQTKDFSAWLDYIKQSISSKRKNEQEEQSSFYGFGGAIKQISRYDDESRFSNNVFVILGSKQTLSLHEQQLSWLATQPARLLFVQIDRASGTSYQDFLLQAKSILDSHSTKYIDHISNYIADSRLVKTELFKNIEATDANLYLYDAPYNLSLIHILEAENKNVNIHVLFNDADLPYLSPYINVLQNLKLKMKPGYDYTFSATCISSNGENRHLAPTKDFSAWLDYIKQSI